mgnify:FL=1
MNLLHLLRSEEEVYRSVFATDLTPEELRASKLPNDSLNMILVKFESSSGKKYSAHHHCKPIDSRPYISLMCTEDYVDIEDFENIEVKIAEIVKGVLWGRCEIGFPPTQIKRTIRTIYPKEIVLTQARIADFVDQYKISFDNVIIGWASFKDLPKSLYENSGLPPEKLRITIP